MLDPSSSSYSPGGDGGGDGDGVSGGGGGDCVYPCQSPPFFLRMLFSCTGFSHTGIFGSMSDAAPYAGSDPDPHMLLRHLLSFIFHSELGPSAALPVVPLRPRTDFKLRARVIVVHLKMCQSLSVLSLLTVESVLFSLPLVVLPVPGQPVGSKSVDRCEV